MLNLFAFNRYQFYCIFEVSCLKHLLPKIVVLDTYFPKSVDLDTYFPKNYGFDTYFPRVLGTLITQECRGISRKFTCGIPLNPGPMLFVNC